MNNLKYLGFIIIFTLFSSCQGDVCLNPDCAFPKLKTPIVLTGKSFDRVTVIDSEGTIWSSSTGWETAQSILVGGHNVGDTIIYKP